MNVYACKYICTININTQIYTCTCMFLHTYMTYISICFSFQPLRSLYVFIFCNFMPNVWLQLATSRSRVVCSGDWASQVPPTPQPPPSHHGCLGHWLVYFQAYGPRWKLPAALQHELQGSRCVHEEARPQVPDAAQTRNTGLFFSGSEEEGFMAFQVGDIVEASLGKFRG